MMPILRADSVTVLRDFSGYPLGLRKCGDQVAHKLRLPNAAGVTANNDDPPTHALPRLLLPPRSRCVLW